jgi:hypothetical protein
MRVSGLRVRSKARRGSDYGLWFENPIEVDDELSHHATKATFLGLPA